MQRTCPHPRCCYLAASCRSFSRVSRVDLQKYKGLRTFLLGFWAHQGSRWGFSHVSRHAHGSCHAGCATSPSHNTELLHSPRGHRVPASWGPSSSLPWGHFPVVQHANPSTNHRHFWLGTVLSAFGTIPAKMTPIICVSSPLKAGDIWNLTLRQSITACNGIWELSPWWGIDWVWLLPGQRGYEEHYIIPSKASQIETEKWASESPDSGKWCDESNWSEFRLLLLCVYLRSFNNQYMIKWQMFALKQAGTRPYLPVYFNISLGCC